MTRPPRDNLVRALAGGVSLEDDGKTLFGRIAPAGEWAEINSSVEGNFLERNVPGAFKKTFAERLPKVQFNHGKDPQLGNQLIAETREVGEDEQGAFYRAEILPGVPQLILEGLKRGLYGSSHTFSVIREAWNDRPKPSDYNPKGLPERTILEARVPELGPVTWPAFAGAFAGVRSMTDEYVFTSLTSDPERVVSLFEASREDSPPEVDAGPEPTSTEDAEAPPEADPQTEATDDPPEGGSSDSRSDMSTEYVSREDKASRVSELKAALKRTAEDYTGVLPTEVQATFDADSAELRQLTADIAAWDKRQEFVRSLGEDESRTEGAYNAPTIIRTKSIEDIYDVAAIENTGMTREKKTDALRDNAMRSIDASRFTADSNVDALGDFIDLESREDGGEQEATRRILLTGSPAYKRFFTKYLKNGNDRASTPEEQRAAALAVTGTTTTGGYAVPYIFDPTFIHIGAHTSINPYRAACRVETISGGNNWRAVTASAITAKWDTEAAASVEGGPTIGQPTFTVQRADAFATVSIETLQDRPDVTAELSSLFGEAKDTLEENSFTLGTGATVYPFGMFRTLAFTAKATATSDVTVLLDLIAIEGDLPLRHRMNAAWFFSRSTQRQLEALDTTGYYFKRPGQFFAAGSAAPVNSPTGNTGTQLLGYPVWEVPSAVSTLSTDAAQIAVFGDPKNYVIVDRIGMNVEVVPTMLNGATPSFPTGQRGIYCYWRGTARPLNVDGMRQLVVA